MKHFVQNLILVILLTILLLFSYAFVQKKTEKFGFSEFYQFLMNHESGQNNERAGEKEDAPAAEKQNSTSGRYGLVIWSLTLIAALLSKTTRIISGNFSAGY